MCKGRSLGHHLRAAQHNPEEPELFELPVDDHIIYLHRHHPHVTNFTEHLEIADPLDNTQTLRRETFLLAQVPHFGILDKEGRIVVRARNCDRHKTQHSAAGSMLKACQALAS